MKAVQLQMLHAVIFGESRPLLGWTRGLVAHAWPDASALVHHALRKCVYSECLVCILKLIPALRFELL